MIREGIGLMLTPYAQRKAPDARWSWAADNGCFSERWDAPTWLRWLERLPAPETALFATVPDVVADHNATLDRWDRYAPIVKALGFKIAFVLQDGATEDTVPWDELDVLFIGGSTDFKLSPEARNIAKVAKARGKNIHMGRVNSYKRMAIAKAFDCDTADGTFLAFAPDHNISRLLTMLGKLKHTAIQLPIWD